MKAAALATSAVLQPREYDWLRELLLRESGIFLSEQKGGLIESRLNRRLRELDLTSFAEYVEVLRGSPAEVTEFVNVMTTNKTDFFREPAHFTYLTETLLPELAPLRRELTFWSAASSTGEEAVTLAMTLDQFGRDLRYRILGTDLDDHALAEARAGVYRASLVEAQVPEEYRRKYFLRGTGRNRGLYRVADVLSDHVRFTKHNLIQGELSVRMMFDVIFLRNVLIYFQTPTIEIVIARLCEKLRPGGHLFIGHSESLQNCRHELTQVGPSIFRKAK